MLQNLKADVVLNFPKQINWQANIQSCSQSNSTTDLDFCTGKELYFNSAFLKMTYVSNIIMIYISFFNRA